jgi:hypothetical protein
MTFGSRGDLGYVLSFVLGLRSFEFEGPEELLRISLPGDWIVRNEAPLQDKFKALEQITAAGEGRKIHFERRSVDRDAIVATGEFDFHPLEGTYNDAWLHLYSDVLDPTASSGGGPAGSVADLLRVLGDCARIPVIDKTQTAGPINMQYGHHSSSWLRETQDPDEKQRKLQLLLDNLTKQTDLHFKVERQSVEVWFVMEEQP